MTKTGISITFSYLKASIKKYKKAAHSINNEAIPHGNITIAGHTVESPLTSLTYRYEGFFKHAYKLLTFWVNPKNYHYNNKHC